MSPRLILILALVACVSAAGASVITWIAIRPEAFRIWRDRDRITCQ